MPTLADVPELLADLETQAHLHELRALSAVGPARWDDRQRWLDRAERLREVAQRLRLQGEVSG